jgi:hypothetical protein
LALVDALGNLVRFSLWPGQRHDSLGAPDLIDGLTFEALLGDKPLTTTLYKTSWRSAGLKPSFHQKRIGNSRSLMTGINIAGVISSKTILTKSRTSALSPRDMTSAMIIFWQA